MLISANHHARHQYGCIIFAPESMSLLLWFDSGDVLALAIYLMPQGVLGGILIHDYCIVFLIRRTHSVGKERRQKVAALPLTAPHQLHLIRDHLPTALRNFEKSAPDQVAGVFRIYVVCACIWQWLLRTGRVVVRDR